MSSVAPEERYFTLATQYYVCARAAAFAKVLPVCGNQFHHCIEMYLKGYLSGTLSSDDLKDLKHNLRRIWQRFKSLLNDPKLDKYDVRIKQLDKFEEIRYPDRIVRKGMFASVSIKRPSQPASMSGRSAQPRGYHLVVEELDELVKVIFDKCSLNPDFFFSKLGPEARSIIGRDNTSFKVAKRAV